MKTGGFMKTRQNIPNMVVLLMLVSACLQSSSLSTAIIFAGSAKSM